MPSYAATATTAGTPIGLLVAAAVIVTVGYGLVCWLRPFTACRRCHGTGHRRTLIGRTARLCRTCDGNGRRLRTGRRIANNIRELHDNADHR
ncbi:hypothetical protein AB0M79_15065 [Polymorphospora sp. NPDC051019]|uniref:hypothetical protein n=1 Tax=Polymorphospora sp. NPDC051019 TaxID=3155725 RepID=UPI0034223C1E